MSSCGFYNEFASESASGLSKDKKLDHDGNVMDTGGRSPLYLIGSTCNSSKQRQEAISDLENVSEVLIHEAKLALLDPSQDYLDVMKLLGYNEDQLKAQITGYGEFWCKECDKSEWFPNVQGIPNDQGYTMYSYNPYLVLRRAAKSASRALSSIDAACEICSWNDPYLMDLTLTYPKDTSRALIKDEEKMKRVTGQVVKTFINWLEVFFVSSGAKIGPSVNTHTWSSKEPSEPHLHHHMQLINQGWDPEKFRFFRFNPYLSEERLSEIRKAWKDILIDFGLKEDDGKDVDVYYQFISFKMRGRILHILKYRMRSVIVDIAEYFNEDDHAEITDDVINGLRDSLQHGKVNRTVSYGWWRTLKRCVSEFIAHSESLRADALQQTGEDEDTEDVFNELVDRERVRFEAMRNEKIKYCPFCGNKLAFSIDLDADDFHHVKKGIVVVELDKKGKIGLKWVLGTGG